MCCSDEEKAHIMGFEKKIRSEYKNLTRENIYFVLIFIYYALKYDDQNDIGVEDWRLERNPFYRPPLNPKKYLSQFWFGCGDKHAACEQLYFDLTVDDKMIGSENVSKMFRRKVMGFDE